MRRNFYVLFGMEVFRVGKRGTLADFVETPRMDHLSPSRFSFNPLTRHIVLRAKEKEAADKHNRKLGCKYWSGLMPFLSCFWSRENCWFHRLRSKVLGGICEKADYEDIEEIISLKYLVQTAISRRVKFQLVCYTTSKSYLTSSEMSEIPHKPRPYNVSDAARASSFVSPAKSRETQGIGKAGKDLSCQVTRCRLGIIYRGD